MSKRAPSKQEYVVQELAKDIRFGHLKPGARVPSDRSLARRFDVSYMTARRAVNLLVGDGLLERRPRSGTFVSKPDQVRSRRKFRVNIIATTYSHPSVKEAVDQIARCIRMKGWRPDLIGVPEGDERRAVQAIQGPGGTVLLMNEYFGWRSITEAAVTAADRVVVFGARLDELGVVSVTGDDAEAMWTAVRHLRALGHTRIALAMHHPELRQTRVRIAAWRAAQRDLAADDDLRRRLVHVDVSPYRSHAESTYRQVAAYLAAPQADATALVCINVQMAIGAMAACRDAGLVLPRQMSIFATSDEEAARFAPVPITGIAIDRAEEARMAVDLLEKRLQGDLPAWDCLHLVPPRLIARQSTCPPAG